MKRGKVLWFGRLKVRFVKVSDDKYVVRTPLGAKLTAPAVMFAVKK